MALHFASPLPDLIRPMTFIHVPKTAGTSFVDWVVANQIPHESRGMHATLHRVREFWPDLGYTFGFVRNPYARLVSYFHYVGQQAEAKLAAMAQGHVPKKRIDPQHAHLILQDYRQGFHYWFTREYHGDPTALTTDKTFMNWRQPQTYWIRDCDRVMRVEDLDQEFGWIKSYFHVVQDLPHVNSSQHGDYRDYYNTETRSMVQQMWGEDLDRFQYVF